MEDFKNFTNILSSEEEILLENLINKLAVNGITQYNTTAATILFRNSKPLNEKINDLLEENTIKNSKAVINQIEEIKVDLNFIDDYINQMQNMLKSKPIVTNLEKIREYIKTIIWKLSKLK